MIANAELFLDQIAVHRAGPDAAAVSGDTRPVVDPSAELESLLIGELGGGPWSGSGEKAGDPSRLVPLKPPVHRASGDIGLGREVDDAPALDVPKNGACATPGVEVLVFQPLSDEESELVARRWFTSSIADRLAIFRTHGIASGTIEPR